jgi:hypothetical protein
MQPESNPALLAVFLSRYRKPYVTAPLGILLATKPFTSSSAMMQPGKSASTWRLVIFVRMALSVVGLVHTLCTQQTGNEERTANDITFIGPTM